MNADVCGEFPLADMLQFHLRKQASQPDCFTIMATEVGGRGGEDGGEERMEGDGEGEGGLERGEELRRWGGRGWGG